ncbi:9440_t:CDS:1, partial [Racocetra persica]
KVQVLKEKNLGVCKKANEKTVKIEPQFSYLSLLRVPYHANLKEFGVIIICLPINAANS